MTAPLRAAAVCATYLAAVQACAPAASPQPASPTTVRSDDTPDSAGRDRLRAAIARRAAGGGPADAPADAQPASVRPLAESARLFASANSSLATAGVQVLRDQAAWERAWRALRGESAGAGPPAVDFAREMVVVVAAGQKSSGGHAVRVDGTSDGTDGALVLHVTATAPGEGCMSTMALTAPVAVVRVPRAAGAVRAVTRTMASPC